MMPYKLTLSVSGADGYYKQIFTAPCRSRKAADERFQSILDGAENYGQNLYPAEQYGVFLSIFNTQTGRKVRTMQIN